MWFIFKLILNVVFVLDIFNVGCVSFLDTTIPINFFMWLFIWLLVYEYDDQIKKLYEQKHDKEK